MLLFCLPYAGGSESIFYQWRKTINKNIQLIPIELKGRGKRIEDNFYSNIEEAVDDIFQMIRDMLYENDYAIYGHSMGSLLSYELYYKIVNAGQRKPRHIYFSGYRAPDIRSKKENISQLPDEEFIKKVIEFGGTPQELLDNQELLQLFIPILRSDFRILENYEYHKKNSKIECNVTVFNGYQDTIPVEDIYAWKNHVSEEFRVYNFVGNHFFINKNVEKITSIINKLINE